jgi:predicted DNA-binding antitoxin AbrB/MazE fold protein
MSAQNVKGRSFLRLHKIATASVLALATAGALVATTATGAGAAASRHATPAVVPDGSAQVTPNNQLVDGEHVTIKITLPNDPDGTVLNVGECSTQILAHQSSDYCDNTPAHSAHPTLENHTATVNYTINMGSDFHPTKAGLKCDAKPANTCAIVVTDSLNAQDVVDSAYTPLDMGRVTHTSVSGKKHLKAGAKLKLTANTTKAFHPTGKVVFRDGKKKIKTVTEKATGVVKAVEKHMKKGKHKITATYSGDTNNRPSKGKLTVKVK